MGRSKGTPKNIHIATRITPRIEGLIKHMVEREGLYVSKWVRKLVTAELDEPSALD